MLKHLPIHIGANVNTEEVGLDNYGAALVDAYLNKIAGNFIVHRKPGYLELCDFLTSSPIDGLFWWDRQACVLGVSNGKCFKITANDGTFSEITGDTFESGVRPTFADYGTDVYGANGGRIIKIPSTGAMAYATDVDAPTTVTHLAVLNKYILANDTDTDDYYYSGFTAGEPDPDAWDGDWSSAEAKVDNLTALGVSDLNVFLAGPDSIEIHYDDSVSFVRESQGVINSGVIAPYSFTYCDLTWCWLDKNRSVVMLNGRTPQVLSESLDKYISGFATVTDMIGDFAKIAGRPMYIMTFPTEGKTLFYDLGYSYWGEWTYYNAMTGIHDRSKMNCICTCPAWNMTLIGDRLTGKVYKLGTGYNDDDGETIRTVIRTPHINHGSSAKKKRSSYLVFRFKKTDPNTEVTAASLLAKWRDNGSTTWKTERTLSISSSAGETEFIVKTDMLGQYKSRQYQFTMPSSQPIALISVEEEVSLLG